MDPIVIEGLASMDHRLVPDGNAALVLEHEITLALQYLGDHGGLALDGALVDRAGRPEDKADHSGSRCNQRQDDGQQDSRYEVPTFGRRSLRLHE